MKEGETIVVETQERVPLKVGVGKYFFGNGCIMELSKEILRFGGRPLVIGGVSSTELILNKCKSEWDRYGINTNIIKHNGECSINWAKKYAEYGKKSKSTVVVGIGGGKCIDLAKAVATLGNWSIITVPTSAATCVATSAVCVMYDDEGRTDCSIPMNQEVDVAIADTEIIAAAPRRTLAAGIMDSIAKLVEVKHKLNIVSYRDCNLKQYIGYINSKGIYEFLINEGKQAYEGDYPAERYTDLIMTNLLHTSIVSGFCSGSSQMALAHALYDSLRKWFVEDTRAYMHGELVAIGILLQMYFNRDSDSEIEKIKKLMKSMNMPMRLTESGFKDTEENRKILINSIEKITNMDDEKDKSMLIQLLPLII